jgi:starch synthase
MGDIKYQDFFKDTLAKYPSQAGVKILFDESLAHRVIAGSDFSLMPSRYEPGGLTQIYSLKYGTIPIVRATGGLKDTIINFDTNTKGGNGIVFSSYDTQSLMTAIDRALAIYYQTGNRETLMKSAMAADFSWGNSARAYLSLYQNLVGP